MKKIRLNPIMPFILLGVILLLSSYKIIFTSGYHLGVDYRFLDACKMIPLYGSSWDSFYYLGQPTFGNPMPNHFISAFTFYYVIFISIFNLLFGTFSSSVIVLVNYISPFVGFWYFASYIYRGHKNSQQAALYAALLYQTNYFFLWSIQQGLSGIFFCLFPIILRIWIEFSCERNTIKYKIGLFLLLSVLISFLVSSWAALTVQFFIFVGLYELLNFFMQRKTIKFFKRIASLISLGFLTIIINPFIFLTYKFYPYEINGNKIKSIFSLAQLRKNSAACTITDALFLYSDYGYVYLIFAIFGAYLFRKTKFKLLIPLWLIGIFLVKGVNPPLVKLSEFIFSKIPLLHFFRSPHKFMSFVILMTCLFIGYFMLKMILPILKNKFYIIFFNLVLFVTIIFFNPLLLSGDLGSFLFVVNRTPHIKKIEEYLKNTEGDKRFLYLPAMQGMRNYTWTGYRRKTYPSAVPGPFFSNAAPIRPLSNASLDMFNFSNRFLFYFNPIDFNSSFLKNLCGLKINHISGNAGICPSNRIFTKLLAKTNTETVILDKTFRKSTGSYLRSKEIKSLLDNNSHLKVMVDDSSMAIYRNTEIPNSFFEYYEGLCYAVAPLSIYEALAKVSVSSIDNPIIFWHQNSSRYLPIYPHKTFLMFYDKTDLDMLGSRLMNFSSIPLASHANQGTVFGDQWAPFGTSRVMNLEYGSLMPYLREGLTFVSCNSVATSVRDTLNVNFEISEEGDYHILLRVLFFPEGHKLNLYLNNANIGIIPVKTNEYLGMHWVEVPVRNLKKGKYVLSIENVTASTDLNKPVILDGLSIVSNDTYCATKKKLFDWKEKTKEIRIYSNAFLEVFPLLASQKEKEDKILLHLTDRNEKILRLENVLKKHEVFREDGLFIMSDGIETRKDLVNSLNDNLPLKSLPYEQIYKTHYMVNVPQSSRGLIIFRSTFNTNWKLENMKPNFIIDGYANGYFNSFKNPFMVEELNLRFMPERYYKASILISITALGVITVLSFFLIKSNSKKSNKD